MKKKPKWRFLKRLLAVLLIIMILIGAKYFFQLKRQVAEINKWQARVSEITQSFDLVDSDDIVLAIILTETKGDHLDLMQSSESKYGEQNKISSSEESLYTGVSHLAEVISEADTQGTDIWTAVQAYNFGSNYISYISKNGGENTVELAEAYSRDSLAPALGNTAHKQYRYMTPRAYLYNRGYLYEDGGNFFYAEIVRWNMTVINTINKLPF